MKKNGKGIGVLIAVVFGLAILSKIAPFGVLLGCVGIWYFIQKVPDIKKMIASIALTIVSLILIAINVFGSDSSSENTTTEYTPPKSTATAELKTSSVKNSEEQAKQESEEQESTSPEPEPEPKPEPEPASEPASEPTPEPELVSAVTWVEEHENGNIDTVISDFNLLTDDSLKSQLGERLTMTDTTMWEKTVELKGTVVEFVEGSRGYTKGSFVMVTDDGNTVRIAAPIPNEGVDIGEKVEVKGSFATSLGQSSEYYVREASVYIVIE